jgi:hypothetical protein
MPVKRVLRGWVIALGIFRHENKPAMVGLKGSFTCKNPVTHKELLIPRNYMSPAIAKKLHRVGCEFFAFILILIAIEGMTFGQAKPKAKTPRPRITGVSPGKVSPAVYIDIEGQWLGAWELSDVLVLFVQAGVEHSVESPAGGTADGLQFLDVRVPDELVAGVCQLLVEVKGKRSKPFSIEITSTITPPVLTSFRPRWVQPGEGVMIYGTGFSGTDTFEITDAVGDIHQIDGSKSAETAAFPLPNGLPDGPASLRVVEHRSSGNQRSNSLRFMISHGPVPLDILSGWTHPLGPGQILRLSVFSSKPLEQATGVELTLKQGGLSRSILLKNLKDLRFQIPYAIIPGKMEIQNRTWRGTVASEWSEPVSYKVSDRPAPPWVHNIQIWPAKADAVFMQDGRVVATVPIMLDGLPRVRVPSNLKKGTVTIERRFRRAGHLVKGPTRDHICCPLGDADGMTSMETSDDWIYPLPGKPQTVEIFPGGVLVIEGDFFAPQPTELRVVLACGDRYRQLNLTPWFVDSRQWISVRIPRLTSRGNCSVTVRNVIVRTKATLPITLRIK